MGNGGEELCIAPRIGESRSGMAFGPWPPGAGEEGGHVERTSRSLGHQWGPMSRRGAYLRTASCSHRGPVATAEGLACLPKIPFGGHCHQMLLGTEDQLQGGRLPVGGGKECQS